MLVSRMDFNLDAILINVCYLSVCLHISILIVTFPPRALVSRALSTVGHTLGALGMIYMREHLTRA